MSNYNSATLIGRLGADPELRATPSGAQVANASLAVTEKWKDAAGQQKEKTTWFRLAFWGKRAEIAGRYLRKGSELFVQGPVSARAYQGKDGTSQASLEVNVQEFQMLGGKRDDAGGYTAGPAASDDRQPAHAAAGAQFQDDDIPF